MRSAHTFTVRFDEAAGVAALRVWNYNKSEEDTCRGIKLLAVELDGVALSPPAGLLLRKAPGHANFDFAQTLPLRPQRESLCLPIGERGHGCEWSPK